MLHFFLFAKLSQLTDQGCLAVISVLNMMPDQIFVDEQLVSDGSIYYPGLKWNSFSACFNKWCGRIDNTDLIQEMSVN